MRKKPGRLQAFFDIQPGERRMVSILFAHSLLNGWAQTASLSVAYSLFVSTFGAQNMAYRYIGGAVVTMLAGFLYAWLAGRLRFTALLTANLAVLGLGLRKCQDSQHAISPVTL